MASFCYTVAVNGQACRVESSKSSKEVALDVLSKLYNIPKTSIDVKRLNKDELSCVNMGSCCVVSYVVNCGGGKLKENRSFYSFRRKVAQRQRAVGFNCIQPYGRI